MERVYPGRAPKASSRPPPARGIESIATRAAGDVRVQEAQAPRPQPRGTARSHPRPGRARRRPAELHDDFDRTVRAFAQAHAGQDDAARETLQAVGLRSPFAEWKLLIRGLLAYYARDDARALENWQRLSADRLPARVTAPLR